MLPFTLKKLKPLPQAAFYSQCQMFVNLCPSINQTIHWLLMLFCFDRDNHSKTSWIMAKYSLDKTSKYNAKNIKLLLFCIIFRTICIHFLCFIIDFIFQFFWFLFYYVAHAAFITLLIFPWSLVSFSKSFLNNDISKAIRMTSRTFSRHLQSLNILEVLRGVLKN